MTSFVLIYVVHCRWYALSDISDSTVIVISDTRTYAPASMRDLLQSTSDGIGAQCVELRLQLIGFGLASGFIYSQRQQPLGILWRGPPGVPVGRFLWPDSAEIQRAR